MAVAVQSGPTASSLYQEPAAGAGERGELLADDPAGGPRLRPRQPLPLQHGGAGGGPDGERFLRLCQAGRLRRGAVAAHRPGVVPFHWHRSLKLSDAAVAQLPDARVYDGVVYAGYSVLRLLFHTNTCVSMYV